MKENRPQDAADTNKKDELNNRKKSEVYDVILKTTDINKEHTEHLKRRGFDLAQITQLQYKSMPPSRIALVGQIMSSYNKTPDAPEKKSEQPPEKWTPDGVPGFWNDGDKKKPSWKLAGATGLMIPVRDIDGKCAFIKIRGDNATSEHAKYTQLSTNPGKDKETGKAKYPGGTAASICMHYPIVGDQKCKTLRITEGELKADMACLIDKNAYTISVPGVNSWRMAMASIELLKPEKVLISFDADKGKELSSSTGSDAKPFAVAIAVAKLYRAIQNIKVPVVIEDWDEQFGKGIDDVLSHGHEDQIKYMDDASAKEFCEKALAADVPLGWFFNITSHRFIRILASGKMESLDKESFNDLYTNADTKHAPATVAMIDGSAQKVSGCVYYPGKDRIFTDDDGRMFLNQWSPTTLVAEEGDIKPFIEHVEFLLPNKKEQKMLLDYLAFCIQNPGQKIKYAILLQGFPGAGKSYFSRVMKYCLGAQNVQTPNNSTLNSEYNRWQKQCQFAVIHELKTDKRTSTMNNLKEMITETTTTIREMRIDPYSQPNTYNFLLLTNHKDAIFIDEHDRRYCVLYSPARERDEEYYTKLFDWTDANAAKILWQLQRRDLSKFKPNGHAPMTDAKRSLISDTRHPMKAWVEDEAKMENWPFHNDIIAFKHLITCIPKHLVNHHKGSHLKNAIADLGTNSLGVHPLSDGGSVALMSIRNHDKYTDMPSEELVKRYEKWSASQEPGGGDNPMLDGEKF